MSKPLRDIGHPGQAAARTVSCHSSSRAAPGGPPQARAARGRPAAAPATAGLPERVSVPPAGMRRRPAISGLAAGMHEIRRAGSGAFPPNIRRNEAMRPSGTSVISAMIRPAPDGARLQDGQDTVAHGAVGPSIGIGETTTRFGIVRPRRRMGANIGGGGRLLAGVVPATSVSTVRTRSGAAFSMRA